MAWRRIGDKPLSEPMRSDLLTHICILTSPHHHQTWYWTKTISVNCKFPVNHNRGCSPSKMDLIITSCLGMTLHANTRWLGIIIARWRHQNGNIFRVTGLSEGNPTVTGGFPSQRPVTRSFDVYLICAWANGWGNNQGAGHLRRHRVRYDVTVMILSKFR